MPSRNNSSIFKCRESRLGMSLLELLSVVAILGVISALALVAFSGSTNTAKENACYVLKGEIELQAQKWFRNKGTWPASNLSDIGSDPDYFPEGLPECPVAGWSFSFDQDSHEVVIDEGT